MGMQPEAEDFDAEGFEDWIKEQVRRAMPCSAAELSAACERNPLNLFVVLFAVAERRPALNTGAIRRALIAIREEARTQA